MKKTLLILSLLWISLINSAVSEGSEKILRIIEGNSDAKITIITYESLTCSHCADFHKNVYPDLKKNFIDTGLVKIEFRHFPLDLAALSASKISLCKNDGKSELMHFLFLNQSKWAREDTIEKANNRLRELINKENIKIDFDKCTNNNDIEEYVLKDRIEGVKKFKVNATPTIIINDEKFEKPLNYKNLKRFLEKMI